MDFWVSAYRGLDLTTADQALEILSDDPHKLDRARSRFGRPPPTYESYSSASGTTTQQDSPYDPVKEEERWWSARRFELKMQYCATRPYGQYEVQVKEEHKRINEAENLDPRLLYISLENEKRAQESVKRQWVEQGIWDESWKPRGEMWRWKHENPLETEPESHTEPKTANADLFRSSQHMETSKIGVNEEGNNGEAQQTGEAQVVKERERDASRPFYQFFYQLSQERMRMQQQLERDGSIAVNAFDINTTAYERTKNIWMDRKIWDSRWGLVPGMSWRHEHPLEEWVEEEISKLTYSRPQRPHECPVNFTEQDLEEFRSISFSPAEPNHEVSPATNPDHQELPSTDNLPTSPKIDHNSLPQHTTPPPPPRQKSHQGRLPRGSGSEKSRPDLPLQDSPTPLRRSKRLRETKFIAVPDIVTEPEITVKRTSRPKRGRTEVDNPTQDISTEHSRPTKRQRRIRK